ncbi:MAG: Adenylate cyclase 2 [Chloroflexi bacterium]|nr:Adenylate cyclase 2 [Chloroflexota bacterium]
MRLPVYREDKIVQALYEKEDVIWLPPERPWPKEFLAEKALLEGLDSRVLAPLRYEEHLVGFLALGEKRSGEPYNSEDFAFLSAAANQSSLSVENVRLFTNLQKTLEQTMEMKNLMDDIFSSMSSGVITTDISKKITLFNRAAEEIAGVSINLAVGKSLPDIMGFLGPRFNVLTESTLKQNQQVLREELTPNLPGRGAMHLQVSCSPLRDAHSDTKGTTIVIDDLTEQYELEAEQKRIRQTFGRVVAPRVRDRLLEDPSNLTLAGESEEISVLFADLHHFTSFSEQVPPEALFEVLNSYLTVAAQAILDEEGTLDKFMGDAAMAFWNAPDNQPNHTLRAVRAALKMNQALADHRALLDEHFQLYFSIGISRGVAMVGNVGTSELFNYTVIGSVVNLAQRLESVAEPNHILLSGPAYEEVAPYVEVKERPGLKLKGHEHLVTAYELMGLVEFSAE